MMNYEIIKDRKLLEEFVEWLPELTEQEKFYCCLFARSKYLKDENGVNLLPHIKTDKSQLKRFVATKQNLIKKIEQLEIPVGRWYQKEHQVPQAALALYITVNPRNMYRATFNSLIKLAQSIRDQNFLMNPHAEVLSEIQRTKSRTCWIDFDLDFPKELEKDAVFAYTEKMIQEVLENVNYSAVKFLKTRGGMHVLVDPNQVDPKYKNSFYKSLKLLGDVDQTGDQMIPVVGCTQGDFTPHFIN